MVSILCRKEKKKCKKCKKSTKTKDKRKIEPLAEMLNPSLPEVTIPGTPSPFAVFAAIRSTCLESRQRQAALMQLQAAAAWKEVILTFRFSKTTIINFILPFIRSKMVT